MTKPTPDVFEAEFLCAMVAVSLTGGLLSDCGSKYMAPLGVITKNVDKAWAPETHLVSRRQEKASVKKT
jgi:hypothetical protein